MFSSNVSLRVGGIKICRACSEFERLCAASIYVLQNEGPVVELEAEPFTLYNDFAALDASAQESCDSCRAWRKALMNECYSVADVESLQTSTEPVQLEPPTEMVSMGGFDIRITSPLMTIIKRTYKLLPGGAIDTAITRDDIAVAETAKRAGRVVGRVEVPRNLNASIAKDALDDILWKRVTRWMKHCVSNHTSCEPSRTLADQPTRLVHIESDSLFRVVDTSQLAEMTDYAALSYSWGGDQAITLTSDRESALRAGMLRVRLPLTLQHALTVCERLKISYLWVDALCIYQSDSGEDFEIESLRMDKIYGNATVTLVISCALSASEGFLHDRAMEDVQIKAKKLRFAQGRLFIQRKSLSEVRAKSPLANRAWCFQEELLSRRLLYCTSHGYYWSCSKVELAENGNHLNLNNEGFEANDSLDLLDPHSFRHRADKLFTWDRMVDRYSSCQVTYPEDRLPAIRGLANLIQQQTGEDFLYGLWRSRLPGQLLWTVVDWNGQNDGGDQSAATRSSPTPGTRPLMSLPSWSWASTPPPQKIRMPAPEQCHSRARLLDSISIDISDSRDHSVTDPSTTQLVLQGRTRRLLHDHDDQPLTPFPRSDQICRWEHDPEGIGERNVWSINPTRTEIFIQEEGRPPVHIKLDRSTTCPLDQAICFEINYKGLLLLNPISETEYCRLGCAQAHDDAAFFVGASSAIVTLV